MPRHPRPDLQAVLESTGNLAPKYVDGVCVNDTPDISHLGMDKLKRALQAFKPETELELCYWSALHDIVQRGGHADSAVENAAMRRLERDIYLAHGFQAERLQSFYRELSP